MNEVMYSSKSELWGTPQNFFDELNKEFGFDLDPCALPSNAKCDRFFTPEEDGLAQNWGGQKCFAIHLTERKYQNGCVRVMKKVRSQIRWWLCFCQQGLTQLISTIIYTTRQRYVLSVGGYISMNQRIVHRSRQWL